MIFIIWFILCLAVANCASDRGCDGVWWFVLSILLSPIIAGGFLLILGAAK